MSENSEVSEKRNEAPKKERERVARETSPPDWGIFLFHIF
jgi:hypothetical protein